MMVHAEPEAVWREIMNDLTRSGANYFPEAGDVLDITLLRVEKRNHCEIGEVCVHTSGGDILLVIKRLVDGREDKGSLIKKAEEELNHIMRYAVLLENSPFIPLRWVGNHTQYQAVVTHKVSGIRLNDLIKRSVASSIFKTHVPAVERSCEEAGKWLRVIHSRSLVSRNGDDPGEKVLDMIRRKLRQCIDRGLNAELECPVLSFVQNTLKESELSVFPMVMVHNDFTPENIIVSENGIVVLDYQAVERTGTPYDDLAIFVTYIESLGKNPICGRAFLENLKSAFFRGYGENNLSTDVMKVFQINALLSFYCYLPAIRGAFDITGAMKRFAFSRWTNNWLAYL